MAHQQWICNSWLPSFSISDFNVQEDEIVDNKVDKDSDRQVLTLEAKVVLMSTIQGKGA